MIPLRRVKSFVIRAGRLSSRQSQALADVDSSYKIIPKSLIDWALVFPSPAPITLEIGFGMGQSLLENARLAPERYFVGIEVHPPGIGALLAAIKEQKLANLYVIQGDAVTVIAEYIPDNSIDRIQIFFPDPWPKRRHHKRRLIQSGFIACLQKKLAPGGILHIATDWEDYATYSMQVLSSTPGLYNTQGLMQFATDKQGRALTKYEKRGTRLGHGIWDMVFCKAE